MTIKTAQNLRRISQIVFFLIFFWLILKTNFDVNLGMSESGEITLPYPVSIALELDPLVALGILLADGTIFKGLLWSLVVLIPTIFMGRIFCGWVCPLGSLNHWISEIPSERLGRKGKGKIDSNRYKKYQRIKYYLFFFFIAAALLGSLQLGLLDPLSLMARSIGTAVLPAIHTVADGLLLWIKSWGISPLGNLAQLIYDLASPILLTFRPAHFHAILTIGLFFIAILVMNRVFTRFWCRGICPLGAMLGIFSRYAIFGLEKDDKGCDGCNLCLLHCQGADGPDINSKWRQSECVVCLNCQAICPNNSLKFKFFPRLGKTEKSPAATQKVDITRRKVAVSVAAGLAMVPLYRTGDAYKVNSNPGLIRPPGAIPEKDFLSRCIRCGQCMRVCPNNALHPTFMESGAEGIWTPIMIPRIGYCEPTCTLCGQVCPTGAITELTVKEKVGDDKTRPVRVGTAFIDRGRCLPWGMTTPCIVCEEWCPTTPKAIYLEDEVTINGRDEVVPVKRPYVDPDRCTGCGACEYACPIINQPAIYVTSIGESRSVENQIILQRKGIDPGKQKG
nr:4Fe-4S dicluster domain-containing protein [candidate division Zixibacteria bacterium]